MRKQMIEHAAFEVATQVRAVEDTIDTALAEIAELQARMVRARSTAGIGVATGHGAFEQLAAALQGLVAARGGMANCHAELVEAKSFVPGPAHGVLRRRRRMPAARRPAPTCASLPELIGRTSDPSPAALAMLSPIISIILLLMPSPPTHSLRGRSDERLGRRRSACSRPSPPGLSCRRPPNAIPESRSACLIVDFLTLAGFVGIALRTDRFWPLWVAGPATDDAWSLTCSRLSRSIWCPTLMPLPAASGSIPSS